MISQINASAFRPENAEKRSSSLTAEECQTFLAQYDSSKIRLWAYNASHSRLVLRVDKPAQQHLPPFDLVFVSLSDLRCPVYWTVSPLEIRHDPDPSAAKTTFEVPSAGVSVTAADLVILIQDEYPHLRELE